MPSHELIDEPARPMTLDAAYRKAYARLRVRCAAIADAEPDMLRRHKLLDAMDVAAEQLEKDLSGWLFTADAAKELARPE